MADSVLTEGSSLGSPGSTISTTSTNALIRGKNFNRYNVIPLSFKGDGIGYTAGYGYNLNSNRSFGNFVEGFPLKYYRVYGKNMNNVTQKVVRLRKDLADTIAQAKNEREAAKRQRNANKAALAKKKLAEREAKKAYELSVRAREQQERNAELGLMEANRQLARKQVDIATGAQELNAATQTLIQSFRASVEKELKAATPGSTWYLYATRAGKKPQNMTYSDLNQSVRNSLEKRFKVSPSYMNKLRRATRLSNTTARRLNRARYALGARASRNRLSNNRLSGFGRNMPEPRFTATLNNTRERGISQAQMYREAAENMSRAAAEERPISQAQIYREAAQNSSRAAAEMPKPQPGFFSRLGSRIRSAFPTRKNKGTTGSMEGAFGR